MGRRAVPIALLTLLVILHGQLWYGRGSVPNVVELRDQLASQVQRNRSAQEVNNQLAAEIHDLREGLEMVEEKARMELGMVKSNEIYIQMAR
jgi:cell division protein FtsB